MVLKPIPVKLHKLLYNEQIVGYRYSMPNRNFDMSLETVMKYNVPTYLAQKKGLNLIDFGNVLCTEQEAESQEYAQNIDKNEGVLLMLTETIIKQNAEKLKK